jgi:hypothetical protein
MKPFKRLELGLIGSLDIPNNGGEIGGFGFGGRVTGGYRLDPAFSLLATLAYLNFNYSQMLYQTGSGIVATNTGNSNTTIFEFLGGLKYRFGSTPIHPYFLAGVGISNLMTNSENTEIVNGVTTSSTSQATNNLYPVAEIGGGLEFPLADDMNIFFQAQYGVVLILSRTTTQTSSGNTNINTINGSVFTDVPMEMGLNFNL